jgi:hypothetical protein
MMTVSIASTASPIGIVGSRMGFQLMAVSFAGNLGFPGQKSTCP